MGTATVVGYALAGVIRARRRSAFVLVGLALAVATLATPTVELDSEIRALVARSVALFPYDFHAVGNLSDPNAAATATAAVDGAVGAEPVVVPVLGTTFAILTPSNGSTMNRTSVSPVFARASFAGFSDRFGLVGSLDLAPTEVAITDSLSNRIGRGTGELLTLVNVVTVCTFQPPGCRNETWMANYTIRSVLATPLVRPPSPNLGLPIAGVVRNNVVVAGLGDLSSMRDQLHLAVGDPPRVAILVWADRSRLIDPYSETATETRVLHLEREIEAVVAPWSLQVGLATSPETGTSLAEVVRHVDEATGFERGLFLLFSLPAGSLGLLFSRMGFEVSLGSRRREIGVLRSRGFSNRQITSRLFVEAAVLGTFGALAGMALAVIVSQAFLGLGDAGLSTGVSVSTESLTIAVLGGVLFAAIAAYPSIQRISALRIVSALRDVSPLETSVERRDARSFVFIVTGAAGLFLILGLPTFFGQTGFLSLLFGAALAILVVLAPVLLILGLVEFATLGTDRPYSVLAHLVRRWTRELQFLVTVGLRRNPKRSSSLTVLVAFSLALALFCVSVTGVVDAHEARTARTVVGGDLFLDAGAVDRSVLEGAAAEPGVAAVVVAEYIPSNLGTLVALNSSSYLRVVPWLDDYYFIEGAAVSVQSLALSGGALVNAAMATALRLHVGDRLFLNVVVGRTIYAVVSRVVGIVLALPGLQTSDAETDAAQTIFIDLRTLAEQNLTGYPTVAPGRRAIFGIQAIADPHVISKTLSDRWSARAIIFEDVLASLRANPFRTSLFGLLATQAGLAVLIMVLALTWTAFASAVEREGEFATMVARGLDRRGIAGLLLGEGLTVGLLGALLAAPVVLVFLWEFVRLFEAARPSLLPLEFLVPPTAWFLLAAALGTVSVGTLLAGVRLGRMNLPRILKLRGM